MSAGEASGDHYIARVAVAVRDRGFDGRIYGMCGAESRVAGVESAWRNDALHVVGISEAAGSVGGILRLMREIRENILSSRPDVLVVADSPDFHLPLIRSVRKKGYRGRIFYISPPSVWAWRKYRVKSLIKFVDVCYPLFAFEHEYLKRAHCDTRWIGHPLVEEFSGRAGGRGKAAKKVMEDIKGPRVPREGDTITALLPGSRRSEIEHLYPALSEAYRSLEERGVKAVFSVAPGLSGSAREMLLKNLAEAGQRYYEGPGRDIMGVSDAVAGSSGTATAEALLLRRYMIVLYKVNPLSYVVGSLLLRGVKFAIPNLLAGEYFYPELIQGKATAANVFREICSWLDIDEAAKGRKIERMNELVKMMGRPGVCDFWAGEILGVLG
jgi:lipid-A-disaccharide synthase